jgi:hypothetical protein
MVQMFVDTVIIMCAASFTIAIKKFILKICLFFLLRLL